MSMKKICEFICARGEMIMNVLAVVVMFVLLVGACSCIKDCSSRVQQQREKFGELRHTYLVRDPRTLNEEQQKWLTLRDDEVSFSNYSIIFKLEEKTYRTKEYIEVEDYEKTKNY